MAQVKFLGAVEGVTGSLHLLITSKSRILLDCGLFQGTREEESRNFQKFPFHVADLDAVVLSHAHLDHSGRLPKLVDEGYGGSIYMTRASCDLLEVLLKDAASLQERDSQWENKRRRRAGKEPIDPLYTEESVQQTLTQCLGLPYGHSHKLTEDVSICFRDAGHILGSAIVEVYIDEDGRRKKLVFSGDLGNSCAALLRDPEVITEADAIMIESTYGDREHRSLSETLEEFEEVIREASENGGNILIPSFAVGRTQEIIFRLGELYQRGLLRHQAVYLDSPMAIAVTEIYHRYQHVYNDEDATELQTVVGGRLSKFLPTLRYSTTTDESMALNRIEKGAIIIAGSGMCNGGRIRHHLKHNLWRRSAHVVFVGHQAVGTPGRALIDGAETLRVAGEEVAVRAKIHTLGGFSAHASQKQLASWLGHFERRPTLFLVHGEEEAKQALQEKLQEEGWKPHIARLGESMSF
ncbi:MBL fold metallo-hydrolase RNA specificity domain-containing protein [Pseudomaricurvus sp. HS19]|uniref:MBL fold metallo-hydrolase RNA specificity domain-containing protein n=1 Tax=Pseudomaricurvus sp. HS19 TaxID=2692626 RepID=UPI0013719535|nr:MBL fold metallo-hydrolase [Pseudomaricurvus sp. HS19]MYM63772.1 MBL fold metallo-hydrolase [Pseudomaricurvus sp. HS19]